MAPINLSLSRWSTVANSARRRVSAFACLLGLMLIGSAAAIEPAPFAASIEIDGSGAVVAVNQVSSPISPSLQNTLRGQIRQWRFEPALQAGKPVRWSTTLFGSVPPMGGWPTYFRHGPRPLVSTPPRYPKSSLGMQINTRTLIEAEVGPDGRVSNTRILAVSSYPDHRDMALQMAQAAEQAVQSWQYEPETRDQQAVASRVLVPIGIRPRQYVGPAQWVYYLGSAADFDADRLQTGLVSHAEGPRFLSVPKTAQHVAGAAPQP